MGILVILLVGIYMLFLVPAFMFTWEGSGIDEIGCSGWICMLAGFPGALLALVIKGLIKLTKIPSEKKAKEEGRVLEQQRIREEYIREKQKIAREKAYQEELIKKRNEIFPNSPVTKDIIGIITKSNEMPYMIEISRKGVVFHFENNFENYIFNAHGFPDFDLNDEVIFANVLNEKLSYRYIIKDNSTRTFHQYGDAFDGIVNAISTHISTLMELKATRPF